MDRISAAGNILIEMNPESWRLIVNGDGQEQVLVEAIPGQPLHYLPVFAQKRRLPDNGALTDKQVNRVVLGWSQQDESWHLGLMLAPELSALRGSRWCEMARWPDPDTNVFNDLATRAGRSLAGVLGCPFNLIMPQPGMVETSPPPPLPSLPLHFELWTLEKGEHRLQFCRAGKWARTQVTRILWYVLLVVIYVALSVLTLQGTIALPKPEFLPYLGLAVAALLIIAILYLFYQLLTYPNRMVVYPASRIIAALKGNNVRWQLKPEDYQAIYVSQVIGKKGKKTVAHYGELNVLLSNGRFRFLLNAGEDDDLRQPEETGDLLVELKQEDVHTDLQAAGLYVAQALGVPCRYDRRAR